LNLKLSVLLPTYKRAYLLSYVLDGLRKQTYKDFDVVIVLKPSGDGTEKVIEKYRRWLSIKLVLQKQGYVVDAFNLGLKYVEGDIIAFLDDDSVPNIDWVQRHVESYEKSNIGGVAGNVIPAKLERNKIIKIKKASHIILHDDSSSTILRAFSKVWNQPIKGMENYLVYLSKAGVVEYNPDISHIAWHQTVKSLLGMGANMSVLSKAIRDFRFPNLWILGLAWEQFLGWHLWKRGYKLIFNPKARVYHLVHGETLTRNIKGAKKDVLRWVENYLLFYRLYRLEPELSKLHRIAWFISSSLVNLKKLCVNKDFRQIARLKGKFYSEFIGLKWLLSRKVGGSYTPLTDLRRFIDKLEDKNFV